MCDVCACVLCTKPLLRSYTFYPFPRPSDSFCCTTNARVSEQNRIHSYIMCSISYFFSRFLFLGLTKSLCVTTLFANKQKPCPKIVGNLIFKFDFRTDFKFRPYIEWNDINFALDYRFFLLLKYIRRGSAPIEMQKWQMPIKSLYRIR